MNRKVEPSPIFQAVLNDETLANVQSIHWNAEPAASARLKIVQSKNGDTITHDRLWRSGEQLMLKESEPS